MFMTVDPQWEVTFAYPGACRISLTVSGESDLQALVKILVRNSIEEVHIEGLKYG